MTRVEDVEYLERWLGEDAKQLKLVKKPVEPRKALRGVSLPLKMLSYLD